MARGRFFVGALGRAESKDRPDSGRVRAWDLDIGAWEIGNRSRLALDMEVQARGGSPPQPDELLLMDVCDNSKRLIKERGVERGQSAHEVVRKLGGQGLRLSKAGQKGRCQVRTVESVL